MKPARPPTDPLLELRGLRFAYGPRQVLGPVDLSVQPADFLGVVGPNGSGKSTLLKLVAGLLRPTGGQVLLQGRPVAALTALARARQVALVPQRVAFDFSYSVLETVLMGRSPWHSGGWWESREDLEIAHDALQVVEGAGLADRPVDALSGGEQQRVLVARALAQRPRLLLLDEATAHLDLHHQVGLLACLREQNERGCFGVVAVLHDLNLASQFCTRVLVLSDGAARALGPPEEVLNAALLEDVFRVQVHAGRLPHSGRPFVVPLPPAPASLVAGGRVRDTGDPGAL